MNKTTLKFLKAGLQTRIQDRGRPNNRSQGVSVGGALDQESATIANKIVGNDLGSPVFETTILGPSIQFTGDECFISITGADMSPTLNGKPIEMYKPVRVDQNSILDFGRLNSGCRGYIAVNGKWQVRNWLNSASATFPDLPDVTPDSFIVKGSAVNVVHSGTLAEPLNHQFQPQVLREEQTIRVLPGPEIDMFSQVTLDTFFSTAHPIMPASNRWGYRLDSHIPTRDPGQEIISSGVIPGTIQIPHSGGPIILMADAQTTGGYPRLAVVISEDMDSLGQAKPGDTLRFRMVALSELSPGN